MLLWFCFSPSHTAHSVPKLILLPELLFNSGEYKELNQEGKRMVEKAAIALKRKIKTKDYLKIVAYHNTDIDKDSMKYIAKTESLVVANYLWFYGISAHALSISSAEMKQQSNQYPANRIEIFIESYA